jgi:hypothetical protein
MPTVSYMLTKLFQENNRQVQIVWYFKIYFFGWKKHIQLRWSKNTFPRIMVQWRKTYQLMCAGDTALWCFFGMVWQGSTPCGIFVGAVPVGGKLIVVILWPCQTSKYLFSIPDYGFEGDNHLYASASSQTQKISMGDRYLQCLEFCIGAHRVWIAFHAQSGDINFKCLIYLDGQS